MAAMELVEFLLARIAEDEQAARRVKQPEKYWPPALSDRDVGTPSYPAEDYDADVEFVERFNPARVLAECEAKRHFLDAVFAVPMWPDEATAMAVERAIVALAQSYADHPDNRQEWRP